MEREVIKIALAGPESTGKSTLSAQLAGHYNTSHTIEFARQHLEENGPDYTYEDIIFMAENQLLLEKTESEKANQILFCDTEFINFKIWLDHYGYPIPEWIEKHIASRPYHLVLLMQPDIPWEPDPLREHPDRRDYFYALFKKHLTQYGYHFVEIKGSGKTRLDNAIESVETCLKK
jgi:NadR type nicotinamide-nucleotide adenylyltransferase